MPQILTLTAALNGITDLAPHDPPDQPFYYTFTLQCTSCRETHGTPVGISRHEEHEIPGSKGKAHLLWRCKNCKREHSAVIKSSVGSGLSAYSASDPPKRQAVLEIDARGIDLVAFHPDQGGEFTARGAETTTRFEGMELGEDWFDYDDKAREEVSLTDAVWEIRRNV